MNFFLPYCLKRLILHQTRSEKRPRVFISEFNFQHRTNLSGRKALSAIFCVLKHRVRKIPSDFIKLMHLPIASYDGGREVESYHTRFKKRPIDLVCIWSQHLKKLPIWRYANHAVATWLTFRLRFKTPLVSFCPIFLFHPKPSRIYTSLNLENCPS